CKGWQWPAESRPSLGSVNAPVHRRRRLRADHAGGALLAGRLEPERDRQHDTGRQDTEHHARRAVRRSGNPLCAATCQTKDLLLDPSIERYERLQEPACTSEDRTTRLLVAGKRVHLLSYHLDEGSGDW